MAGSRTRTAVVLLGLLLTATCPSVALADVAGPDESVSQAYGPLESGSAHSGAFASVNDVDYLSFVVGTAGQTLNFGVQNTTQVCNDPYAAGCPVYATLMDSSGMNQLGGDGSGAGTIATSGDTETFSWTFTQPGTYYLLMESDGDLPPGSPSYAVSLTSTNAPASSGSSGGSGALAGSGPATGVNAPGGAEGPPSPIVRELHISRRQRGRAVAAELVLGQPAAQLRAELLIPHRHGGPTTIAHRTLRGLPAGAHRLALGLPGPYRRRLGRGRQLSLLLRITILTSSGEHLEYTRRVTLSR